MAEERRSVESEEARAGMNEAQEEQVQGEQAQEERVQGEPEIEAEEQQERQEEPEQQEKAREEVRQREAQEAEEARQAEEAEEDRIDPEQTADLAADLAANLAANLATDSADQTVVIESTIDAGTADVASPDPLHTRTYSRSSEPGSPASTSSLPSPVNNTDLEPVNPTEPANEPIEEDHIELQEEPEIIDPEATIDELRSKAAQLQSLLGNELDEVRRMKTSCSKLKQENKSLQEYIESLMARR